MIMISFIPAMASENNVRHFWNVIEYVI